MFQWTPEKIRFLRDASEYTPFNRVLAQHALKAFSGPGHVLDAGCGIGCLSLELAPFCERVTALDTSGEALDVLRERVRNTGTGNIRILQADVFRLPETEQFDCAVFCFFGTVPEILPVLKKHVRSTAVLIKKNWARHRFSASRAPMQRFSYRESCRDLEEAGIPFRTEEFRLETGQPFRSLSDARVFFAVHGRDGENTCLTDRELESRLVRTGKEPFPFVLSAVEPVGIIVLDAGSVPD